MELYFSSNYDTNSLFLLQVPKNLLENIEKEDELIIKGNSPTILCTKDKGYELKILETTNTLLIVKNKEENQNQKEIILKTDHSIEATSTTPRKYYIYNLLKKFCVLKYDTDTSENNLSSFKQKYSLKDLFCVCDLPSKQFNNLIEEMHIFEYNENIACLFDFNFVIKILVPLLKALAYLNEYEFDNIDKMFQILLSTDSNFEEIINKMNKNEKRNLIEYISDIKDSKITLNVEKIKKFVSKSLFQSDNENNNYEFKLANFTQLFNNALILYLPIQLYNEDSNKTNNYVTENTCDDNLYPGYKKCDLRFLIGQCIIYMSKSYNEPLIKWIDISQLSEKFEERINELFSIKSTWNMKELTLFLQDLEIANVQDRIMRLTRPVQEDNIFDKTKKISSLYLKKNPFFNKKI